MFLVNGGWISTLKGKRGETIPKAFEIYLNLIVNQNYHGQIKEPNSTIKMLNNYERKKE